MSGHMCLAYSAALLREMCRCVEEGEREGGISYEEHFMIICQLMCLRAKDSRV